MLLSVDEFILWSRTAQGPSEIEDPGFRASLTAILTAAQVYVEERCGRVLEPASFTTWLDGSDAGGRCNEILWLPNKHRFVALTPTIQVQELGQALTVSSGYDPAAAVIVADAAKDAQARLIRTSGEGLGGWPTGRQNVKAVYTAGGATEIDKQLVQQVALLFVRLPKMLGVVSKSKQGVSTVLDSEFPAAIRTLIALREVA